MTRRWFVIAALLLIPSLAHAIKILEPIVFDRGSAALRADSDALVKAIAVTLVENPDIQVLEIQGHASIDDAATEAKRLDLSSLRATAVRERLVRLGVARGRLRVQGYGSSRPVDAHGTALAASKNRRIELVIVKRAS